MDNITKVNFKEESEGGQRGIFVIACRELLPSARTNVVKKRRYLFENLAIDYGSLKWGHQKGPISYVSFGFSKLGRSCKARWVGSVWPCKCRYRVIDDHTENNVQVM